MKKKLQLLFVLVASSTFTSFSQTYLTQVKPAGSKTWGYANQKGELVIAAQYAKCYKFSPEGLAAIYDQEEKQYHFINPKNERLATETKSYKLRDGMGFDVEGFMGGLALIRVGEKWGYMDVSGKLVISAKYDDANDFTDGHAAVKTGTTYFIIDKKGTETAVEGTGIVDIKDFTEGLAPYKTADKKTGFIGTDGKIAIPAQYESVGYFKNGLAWAKQPGGTLGYVNPKGEWVIKPQFTAGKNFEKESGLARVKVGEKWTYVNKAGEVMNISDADALGDFSEGLADGKKGEKKGFYNSKGEWVIQPQFQDTRDFKNGFAAAKLGEKWGMINKKGEWVIQPTFDGIKDMEVVN